VFVASEIQIGSHSDSDVVITGADARHARYVIKDAKYIIVDLKSAGGTLWNGRRMTSPMVVRPGDVCELAGHRMQIVDVAARREQLQPRQFDADEEALLLAIHAGDEHSRDVYADLLEARGDLARAELVRILDHGPRSLPMLELMIGTDPAWRMRIARPPIEGPCRPDCPRTWNALSASGTSAHCHVCGAEVRYCATVDDAAAVMVEGTRAVVDPLALRWSRDLDNAWDPGVEGPPRRRRLP
jgi:uncharacterized protein (TIGR02996 family)